MTHGTEKDVTALGDFFAKQMLFTEVRKKSIARPPACVTICQTAGK
jgi:hypothetical protein